MGVKESGEAFTDGSLNDGKNNSDNNVPDRRSGSRYLLSVPGFYEGCMLLGGYVVFLFGLYGVLSFTSPDLLSVLNNNLLGTVGVSTLGFVFFGTITKIVENISGSSFVAIDRKARGESRGVGSKFGKAATSSIVNLIADGVRYPGGIELKASKSEGLEFSKAPMQMQEASGDYKVAERERVLGTAFEVYVCGVVESLDKHISLTEEKGSNLLDRGLLFLFGGILFYVAAIVGWQMWAKYGEPEVSVMYIGMFASSIVFLVCEFLAAWFLKQYRHYVDASLACLRVKSVYDRYMLSYYAVKEMAPEVGEVSEKLNRVLEAIKEDVMWPGHKDNMNNDFNYMIESMSAVHASLDKIKGIFDSKSKRAAESNSPEGKE
ncbi:hypothetical protein D3C76_411810 [compost metagenome]|jgi:hypothetical protein|uniref:hypothetical protein n=1 Tax=Pseudomonas TaxID=286 RepID=UPI000FAF96E0|nr:MULTISPECIES: hypothetical protein [Pseudomonas]VVP29353.1 hypothetical protein PS893_04262 [Pseudomonas fluorescens]